MYLNCHSFYSLRYGIMPIEILVQEAKRCAVEFLALTDVNNTTGVFDFVKTCKREGIKPIVGVEIRTEDKLLYICLAKNLKGFREINELLTKANLGEMSLPLQSPHFTEVFVIYPTSNIPVVLQQNEFIGIKPTEFRKFKNPIFNKKEKLVCLHPVTYQNEQQFELHKLLRCVDHNILLSHLKDNQHSEANEFMIPIDELKYLYREEPIIIKNTQNLADQCEFNFNFEAPKNKKTFTSSKYEDKILLETLALEGFRHRYKPNDQVAKTRLYEELDVIDKLQFACYFLTTWDIVRYSMNSGYFHVGRGSGANSLVAYCLKITEVDPIELNLYFARFLNKKRSSPPDFDIDWSWRERDDIIAYIFKRFGREYTGFCGTVTDFKYRSMVRELGKVYGLPKEEMDVLSRKDVRQHYKHEIAGKIHEFSTMLEGFPNQYSMHSCGIFISEEPISTYSAMNIYPKGVPTCEIDMYIAETIHLEKIDILSQRGLGHIKEAIEIVKENKGIEIDISDNKAFKQDAKCNEMLVTGKTLGCFYIESPAMRGLLRRLKCDNYETLVAASSIIRPGVAQSGMMREYVERHRNPAKIKYFHKVFEEQLSDTYGVMVYQEDVIKIAHHFANMGLDEADVLRRGMSGKSRGKGEMERVKSLYFENCRKIGYAEDVINEVYRQIESFAGYSFCKSHSASYAVESYQSLFLKAHYPLEFITAVINNNGGFYRPEVYINEAKILGAKVEPPDINESKTLTSLKETTIYLGLNQVIHLSGKMQVIIPAERQKNGIYQSLFSFIERTGITYDDISYLIFVGAFRTWNKPKGQLIIEAKKYFNHHINQKTNDQLFKIEPKQFTFRTIEIDPIENAYDELEWLGYPVSISPFDLLKTKFRGDILVKDLLKYIGKEMRMVGYLISIKDVPIHKKDGTRAMMNFGTWIDVEGSYFDTTHFPNSLAKYPFKGLGCYLMLGKIVVDFDFPSIEISKMEFLPMVPDPRFSEDNQPNHDVWSKMKVAYSFTSRDPYPSQDELDELYGRKPVSGKYDHKPNNTSPQLQLGGR
ncbi:MAG: DNA polymerase III subunit alpha [Cytophagales bacterium]